MVVPDATLLVAGNNGLGKRTGFEEYRLQTRGGKGVITMKTTEKSLVLGMTLTLFASFAPGQIAFNDRSWLDQDSHPHSEKLHIVDRIRRPDLGHLEMETTVEDPGVLAKPFTMKRVADLAAGHHVDEFICTENERDVLHMVGR